MILSALRTSVAAELGLDNTAASADQLLIDQWLNQGVRDILLRSHCYVASTTQALTAATTDYQLATSIMAIIDASTSTDGGRMERLGSEEFFEMRRRNSGATGDTQFYTVLGSNLLMIWPAPSASGTLTLYYVPRPTEMSSAAHDPATTTYGNIPVEFHRAIELYAFWQGAMYDDDESSKVGQSYMQQYESFLAKTIRPAVSRKGGSRMPRARIGGRAVLARSRNDVY